MPNKKMKDEHYQNMGGINSKVSPYLNGPHEFLDLINFDFQTPGSLTQRWGTTQYTSGASFFGTITGLYEYGKLDGSSNIIATHTGAIWSINASLAVGISAANMAATFSAAGTSYLVYRPRYRLVVSDTSSQPTDSGITTTIPGTVDALNISSANMDYVTYNNFMFMADGNNFIKHDGTNVSAFSLPPGFGLLGNYPSTPYSVSFALTGLTTSYNGFAINLYYGLALYYTNARGYNGPLGYLGAFFSGATPTAINLYGLTIPPHYGISNARIVTTFGYTTSSPSAIKNTFYSSYGASNPEWSLNRNGAGFTTVFFAQPQNGVNTTEFYNTVGSTYAHINDLVWGLTTTVFSINKTMVPRYLEVFQNRLMMSGFSLYPSTVWFSDVGEPEGIDPTFNFEVRTNDGDKITCKLTYGSRLLIFKYFSYHVLTGDNTTNFNLSQVSNEYGCINNRCAVVYNDLVMFLDRKGLITFNGASSSYTSDKIQPVIERINFAAAVDTACMVNDKSRNSVLIAVPVDGSLTNNLTIVYDYLNNSWTKYDGYNSSMFAVMSGRLAARTAFIGGYSGAITHFGSSFQGDNGAGFTCYAKTAFQAPLGQTTEKQYRRLFLNVDEVTSATVPININFFKNYGASIVLNRTMYLAPFQSRIDFGISGKSLAFELSKFSATTSIKLHGYALAHRYQRDV